MTYTTITLVIPAAHQRAANNCAALFDFDTGGAETFNRVGLSTDGTEPATHYMCRTAIKPHYIPILLDPVQALAALTQLAELYGRTPPVEQDVLDFCANVQASEAGVPPGPFVESLGLRRVVVEEPT